MTTITFYSQGSRVTGFEVKGHSGYAEAGADIVCAAITSAVRLAEATVNDVLGLAATVKVRERRIHFPPSARKPRPDGGEYLSGVIDGHDGLLHPAP